VHGEWLLVQVGNDEGNLMAFSTRTGRRVWVSANKDPAGHTGGLTPMTVEGVPCVAVLTLRNLVVVRLDGKRAGETVATWPWATDYANNIPTPAAEGDSILVTSNYNHRTMIKLQVTLKGARKLWEQRYSSGVCSPVIYHGRIYFAARGLMCLDFGTGELQWEGGRFGDVASCLVTGDGRLIVWANNGDLALVESADRSPKAFKQLASRTGLFRREVWPHIVLADGRLFCKDRDGNLKCFGLK